MIFTLSHGFSNIYFFPQDCFFCSPAIVAYILWGNWTKCPAKINKSYKKLMPNVRHVETWPLQQSTSRHPRTSIIFWHNVTVLFSTRHCQQYFIRTAAINYVKKSVKLLYVPDKRKKTIYEITLCVRRSMFLIRNFGNTITLFLSQILTLTD